MHRTHRPALTAVATFLLGAVFVEPASAALTFSTFVSQSGITGTGLSSATIGFAYAGNKFVGSIQGDGAGYLYQTDLSGGSVSLFAPTVSLAGTAASEHYVSSSLGLGGFPSRDIYVASGNGVMHISNDGTSSNTFVTGLNGTVRGILFDPVGTFGNDMLITTTSGDIYRVNSAGTATLLASTGEDTEGLDIAQTGPDAGKLIVASEGSGSIRSITPGGAMTVIATVSSAEELSVVPLGINVASPIEGFYAANYAVDVQKVDASQCVGMAGDIVITGETSHNITVLHWNGASYDTSTIGTFPNQPEDGIFVSTAIVDAPEPASLGLFALGLGAAGLIRRRKSGR